MRANVAGTLKVVDHDGFIRHFDLQIGLDLFLHAGYGRGTGRWPTCVDRAGAKIEAPRRDGAT